MIKDWFCDNICQPIRNLYHKYISRDTGQLDSMHNDAIQQDINPPVEHPHSDDNSLI